MKKLALMLLFALPFMAASCNEEDEAVTLDQTSTSLTCDGTVTLTASVKDCVWSSDNEFVATVDNKGVVKALREGKANIIATKGDSKAVCEVTVTTTKNNFTIPVIEWGATISSVKGLVNDLTLHTEDAETLIYTTNGDFPIYTYSFNNDALAASSLTVSDEMDTDQDLMGFIEQRYALIEEDDLSYTYANALTLTDATLAVVYQYDPESDSVTATWAPVEHSVRSGEAFINYDLHKKHVQAVRNIVKK